ncbi:MAG: hypothetical protein AB1346_08345 [Thermodesulfobacteriota bacterium]
MNPPIPAPDALPAAWGWFQGLLMLLFPLHLLLMNAMLGFACVSLYALLKGGETDRRLAHELAKALPAIVAFAVNFGVAALLFLQVIYGHLFYASSVLMGLFWLCVPSVLLVAYYAVYIYDFRFESLGKAGAFPAALALLLFLAIGFLFTNNTTLMLEPSRWGRYFGNPHGTLLNADTGATWARYVHFLTSALAVGGLAVALFGKWKIGKDPLLGERAVGIGMHVFAMLTAAQLFFGLWYLVALPKPVMRLFMGGSAPATVLLAVGTGLTFAVIATGFLRKVGWSAALTVPLVYVMAFVRDAVRRGYLEGQFSPETLPVSPEYSPLAMFAATLVAGLAVIAWMLKKTAEVYRKTG